MAYTIEGLPQASFAPLFEMRDDELAAIGAMRTVATNKPGFPCRVSLEDAEPGEELILTHHVSHDVDTPFRMAHAIYIREDAKQADVLTDAVPALFATRTLGLRGFNSEGMMKKALLALPGEADAQIRTLFDIPEIAYIHAHNAAYGCFLAAIERTEP